MGEVMGPVEAGVCWRLPQAAWLKAYWRVIRGGTFGPGLFGSVDVLLERQGKA